MKIYISLLIGISVVACGVKPIFTSRKYTANGGKILEFQSDHSFSYMVRMEGGYVYEFGKGEWRQEGHQIYLFNKREQSNDLPLTVRTCCLNAAEAELIVDVFPKKDIGFEFLPGVEDLLNVDLIANETEYRLKDETNVIHMPIGVDSIYFKCYPKKGVSNVSEILNDTLRSRYVILKDLAKRIIKIEIDSDPYYFARVPLSNDTIRIVNDYKIKWKGKYLFKTIP